MISIVIWIGSIIAVGAMAQSRNRSVGWTSIGASAVAWYFIDAYAGIFINVMGITLLAVVVPAGDAEAGSRPPAQSGGAPEP